MPENIVRLDGALPAIKKFVIVSLMTIVQHHTSGVLYVRLKKKTTFQTRGKQFFWKKNSNFFKVLFPESPGA